MPFITQDKRAVINPILNEAWERIMVDYEAHKWPLEQAGNLAYIVYYIMLLALQTAGSVGWGTLTRVWSDVVLGAGAYFKKHEIDLYEDDRLDDNGPVRLQYDHSDLDDEIPF